MPELRRTQAPAQSVRCLRPLERPRDRLGRRLSGPTTPDRRPARVSTSSRIAVDAMGGDEGLAVMLAGVARARRRFEGMKFILVGDEERIRAGLQNHPKLTAHSEIDRKSTRLNSSH